ncbi:unnamed protein product [Schistosoma turkestanicum]|nr:unnamed protein product [Schistosoma turkestanicum]
MKLTVLFYLNIFVLYIHISSGSEYSSLMMKSLNRKLENADGNEVYFSMMSAYYDEELIYFTKYVNDYLHPANKPINDYFQYLQDLAWNKAFYEYGYYNFHNSA